MMEGEGARRGGQEERGARNKIELNATERKRRGSGGALESTEADIMITQIRPESRNAQRDPLR